MALTKTPINISFAQGLETKSDSKQLPVGKFLALNNMVFSTSNRLTKRNGYPLLTTLPDANQTNLLTYDNNLIATGSNLYAYNADISQWADKGIIQPVQLQVQSLLRASTAQSTIDAAVAANGLVCTTYADSGAMYYQVSDSATGQQVVSRQALPSSALSARVFVLGQYFVIIFLATVSAATHIQYVAIPTNNPTTPTAATDISSTVAASLTTAYDGYVSNNSLYVAWTGTGTTIKVSFLTSFLVSSTPVSIASHAANTISVTADVIGSTPNIWVSFFDGTSLYATCYSHNLVALLAPTVLNTAAVSNITSYATNGLCTIVYDVTQTYGYDSSIRTDAIAKNTITQAGTVGSNSYITRSVDLASKAFAVDGVIYFLALYSSISANTGAELSSQPSFFLIDTDSNIYMRLAYSNAGGSGGGHVLPTVSYQNGQYQVPYLIKDFLVSVNKGLDAPTQTTPIAAIYTQAGINLAQFTLNDSQQYNSEIAGVLHLTGGQLWMYDGIKPVEHGFHVWPELVEVTTASSSGNIAASTYYYAFTYEWTDNQGMLHRSAPSIPVAVTTTGSTSTNTINVPTLRLTAKTSPNPVRIVGYRWSLGQQIYYQFTSVTSPVINDPSVDYHTFTDTLIDSSITGNTILYTTGGVIEDIAAPASVASCLYKNRLFLVDAEDQNLLWYSKQVIENTPVEMSDLFTIYIAPTSGAQGSTGPITALSAMDDKLIIFKKDAIYYINGTGPDNTGANNDFTDPIYISSSVGCANPNSIVLMPSGIMFQSDKGIWLLGRDLSTNYIGSPVEAYNSIPVKSANTIPATNQVRFVLNNKVTLMYDYFQGQWGTFSNISAISATLYQASHTYLNSFGQVCKETPNVYIDGSGTPVLMSLTTSWINVAGVQGYERFYALNLLGTYYTPFKLNMQLAYDYNPSPTQATLITPDNYTAPWGGEANWGSGGAWGGPGNVFSARLFAEKQKCQSFQVSINEVFDASLGVSPGQGLDLSGILLAVGIKKGFRTQSAAKSFG